jgi:6,7-dimethyl-8-ribityllumazine synthase
MSDIKGIEPSQSNFDGSGLCIGIVHGRWNATVVNALLEGTRKKLLESGVKAENIIVQTVPGSYELPFACQK